MYLKEISVKGFKSFPDRTRLEFAPGVSVVVGPNGSGKSNVTDAVLWAMGEQSPLAVRGQSMQDVIFGGGAGRQASRSAEVELVFDNSDGSLPFPAAEVSVMRRLDRNGEGEYRLNGARCRLTDVLEVLSDSGLGKEGHSVIGQGRVEQIVTSKPRDRRLLIEEAAGLGKHRRRRRRAQIKLDRTRDNLDRALDVEREARTRLKPLKRQAEAAEIHARLERQSLEARWSIAKDDLRARIAEQDAAEKVGLAARAERDRITVEAAAIGKQRVEAEEALAGLAAKRDDIASRTYAVRAAGDRIDDRRAAAESALESLTQRVAAAEQELAAAEASPDDGGTSEAQAAARAELSAELRRLDAELERERAGDLQGLEQEAIESAKLAVAASEQASVAAEQSKENASKLEKAREAERAAQISVDQARKALAGIERQIASVDEFLRTNASAPDGTKALADGITVAKGFEAAVTTALGGRLAAAVVDSLGDGTALLDSAGENGGLVLVSRHIAKRGLAGEAPVAGARNLAQFVEGDDQLCEIARNLLADCWLVEDFVSLPDNFAALAVTTSGRSWSGASGELRQSSGGGAGRILEERNRRLALTSELSSAQASVDSAELAAQSVKNDFEQLQAVAVESDRERREHRAAADSAAEAQRRAEWVLNTRKQAPQAGPAAVRRAEVAAELAAEERIAARLAAQQKGATARLTALASGLKRDRELIPQTHQVLAVLERAAKSVAEVRARFDAELAGDGGKGDGVAQQLRTLAGKEAALQAALGTAGEAVTVAEVELQRLRDRAKESAELTTGLASALELEDGPADQPLSSEQRDQLGSLVERLAKRREQLGPVNPLAKAEYQEALEHVEELEVQRTDLETAMSELQGLVRDCDRTIKETFEQTFEAASAHFEELAAQLFPGGRGRLRLVGEEAGPKATLGGEAESEVNPEADANEIAEHDTEQYGVEIEITPGGKSMKRLTLLSGGEKSMTALAFMFAVFLARPCPFYILDEVEAALDDLNLGRFIDLLRAYSGRAQFIVVTHQRRTMEAADSLYGVSMGGDGVSKVVSRRLEPQLDSSRAA